MELAKHRGLTQEAYAYLKIDPKRVHEYLEAGLDPLRELVARVSAWRWTPRSESRADKGAGGRFPDPVRTAASGRGAAP